VQQRIGEAHDDPERRRATAFRSIRSV
jgi:hypothetical protein